MHVRLKEDLIDRLGGQILAVSGAEDLDEGDLESATSSPCFGFLLDDPKAFGASLEKLVRARGLPAARQGATRRPGFGFLLDDPKAVGASREKLVRARGLHAARKSEDYRGFDVKRLAF